jgi:hypothetical protein
MFSKRLDYKSKLDSFIINALVNDYSKSYNYYYYNSAYLTSP